MNGTSNSAAAPLSTVLSNPDDLRCFTVLTEGQSYGLPVECIHTVFEMVAVTPVPLAPPEVLGLVNLRGKIVTAVSLRRRLNGGRLVPEPSILAVGLEYNGESFALVVDEVGDVLTLNYGTRIDMPPHLGAESLKIASVHRLESLILPILDLAWVFAFSERHVTETSSIAKRSVVS